MDLHISKEVVNVTDWVDSLIRVAIANKASDIHIEPMEYCLRVRFRIHGVLWEVMRTEKKVAESIVIRIKAMAQMNIAEKRVPQDGSCRFEDNKNKYDLRISTIPILYGEKVVLRILGNALTDVAVANLGMTAEQMQVFRRFLHEPYGLIVNGGATGTGKSTTLYAGLQEINREGINAVAIEDPIEYHMEGINQVNMDEKAGLSFSLWLRSILRQDPDVIMIGEIRDRETAEIAIRAALTGHLVLSTLHVNRAEEIPLRFLDMGIEPYMLSAALRLIVAQRLVRLLCPHCKRETGNRNALRTDDTPYVGYEAVGCHCCHGMGYSGRIGVFELLPMDEELRNLLTNAEGLIEFRRRCKSKMVGNLIDGIHRYVQEGMVDWREGFSLCDEVKS